MIMLIWLLEITKLWSLVMAEMSISVMLVPERYRFSTAVQPVKFTTRLG